MSQDLISSYKNDSMLLDFDTAMDNFVQMFPAVGREHIELVLRKHDGDVAASVEEILKSQSTTDQPASQAHLSAPTTARSNLYSMSLHSKPNCDSDEKIALMLQNREFLRYLQNDYAFMKELNRGSIDRYSLTTNFGRHESVLSRCRRNSAGWTTHAYPSTSAYTQIGKERVPLPVGPIVDGAERPLSRISQKIKSKIPSRSSDGPRPGDVYPHTVNVDYSNGDERFLVKLKNMSKTSQSMFINLARRFTVSKSQRLRPDAYTEQTHDFSFDMHSQERPF